MLGAPAAPAQALLPDARVAGQGRLTWWGFDLYDARLLVAPGFSAQDFERHPFVLELAYLRALRGQATAERSITEMRRAGSLDDTQAQRWQSQLAAIIPDVKPGDRIAGVNRPGHGAVFFVNGQRAGEIADTRFARLFFAIWLGPATSEPALRSALLKDAAP